MLSSARLAVLAAAAFAAITTELLPVGLLPQISRGLATTQSRTGLLVSAYAVVVAVTSIPLAAALSRWERRRVLTVLLVVYAASNLLLASTHVYWVALGARLVGGAAHAGFFSVVFAAAVTLVPASRSGRAVAFVSAGNALALALGVPLSTALGTAIDWRWAFVAAALALLVLAVLVALVLPAGAAASAGAQRSVLAAVRRGPLLRVALTVVLVTLGHYTLYTYVAPLLVSTGTEPSRVSLVLFGYGLAGVLGTLAAGAAVSHHLRRALLTAVAVLTASLLVLGLLGLGGAPPWATVLTVVVWGAAFGALPALVQTTALRAAPEAPDAGPAVVNATFNIGIAGGALVGAAELHLTSAAVLALTGAPLTASAWWLLATTPSAPRPGTGRRTPDRHDDASPA